MLLLGYLACALIALVALAIVVVGYWLYQTPHDNPIREYLLGGGPE